MRHVKKRLRDEDAYELFSHEMADELGDVLWYVANLAEKLGFGLDEIAERNLRKIRGRWPVPARRCRCCCSTTLSRGGAASAAGDVRFVDPRSPTARSRFACTTRTASSSEIDSLTTPTSTTAIASTMPFT